MAAAAVVGSKSYRESRLWRLQSIIQRSDVQHGGRAKRPMTKRNAGTGRQLKEKVQRGSFAIGASERARGEANKFCGTAVCALVPWGWRWFHGSNRAVLEAPRSGLVRKTALCKVLGQSASR
jgi:hypothetical protein